MYRILGSIWLIQYVHVYKPVDVGTLRLFVQDRVNNFMFDLFMIICTGQVYQVCRIFRNRAVVGQILYNRYIIFQFYKFHVTVLDLAGTIPYIHDTKQHNSNYQGHFTTMLKFIQVGNQERYLNGQVYQQV
ncbi:hypothetical protein D3C72_1768570 [compost metagenome]